MSEQTNPTLSEAITLVFETLLADSIHTCLPGVIKKYDAVERKAEVLPEIDKKYLDGEVVEYQPIAEVPVLSFTAGNSGLRLPESEYIDQTCLLIFSERSMDSWLLEDGSRTPNDPRKFDISDAICIVGLNNFMNKDDGGNDLSLFFNGVDITIKEGGDIELNGGNNVVIKKNGDIELGSAGLRALMTDDIIAKFNTHTHLYNPGPLGAIATGTPATGLPPKTYLATDATLKVKGQ
ncbi:MAG: Gp138 family membrane-puncturing spike protein [Saprospiraceae bacterium]